MTAASSTEPFLLRARVELCDAMRVLGAETEEGRASTARTKDRAIRAALDALREAYGLLDEHEAVSVFAELAVEVERAERPHPEDERAP